MGVRREVRRARACLRYRHCRHNMNSIIIFISIIVMIANIIILMVIIIIAHLLL